jgi:hypothetical protein
MTTPSTTPALQPQIEIEKMLRFSEWLFAEVSHTEIRNDVQHGAPDSNDRDAA